MNLSISSGCLRGRRLKGKGKGGLGKAVLGASETRGARGKEGRREGGKEGSFPSLLPRASLAFCVSRFSLSLPFQTPATQAKSNPALRTPAECGHLIIKDSLLRPLGKKALTFPLNSTCLIRTPR